MIVMLRSEVDDREPCVPYVSRGVVAACSLRSAIIYMKKEFNRSLSGIQVYNTACSLLVMLKNLFTKLHHQKVFNLIFFSYAIVLDSLSALNGNP